MARKKAKKKATRHKPKKAPARKKKTVRKTKKAAPKKKKATKKKKKTAKKKAPARKRPAPKKKKEVVPTFHEWFNGRFWREWVVAEKNSDSEKEAKRSIYKHHLEETLGPLRLDEVDVGVLARLRAALLEKKKR